jgi:hypothetical protein
MTLYLVLFALEAAVVLDVHVLLMILPVVAKLLNVRCSFEIWRNGNSTHLRGTNSIFVTGPNRQFIFV